MSSYKKEKKVSYDMKKYQFIEMLNDVLGSNDMSMLHTSAKNDYSFFSSPIGDSNTEFHTRVYDKLRSGWPEFLDAYREFIRNEIAPHIPTELGLIYQKWPTFRFHLPNNVAVGGWHTDHDYNHPPGEINFIVALTSMFESNTTIAESIPGKMDFHQLECEPGEFIRFNGNQCLHGNLPNRTGVTRVSFDFRVMRLEDYDPQGNNSSLVMEVPYLIGGYYDKL